MQMFFFIKNDTVSGTKFKAKHFVRSPFGENKYFTSIFFFLRTCVVTQPFSAIISVSRDDRTYYKEGIAINKGHVPDPVTRHAMNHSLPRTISSTRKELALCFA